MTGSFASTLAKPGANPAPMERAAIVPKPRARAAPNTGPHVGLSSKPHILGANIQVPWRAPPCENAAL